MTREPSLLELKEDFDEMRGEMRRSFGEVRDTLDRKFLPRELYEANRRADRAETIAVAEAIDEIKKWKTWVARVLIGGIAANVAAALVLYLLLGGGAPQ